MKYRYLHLSDASTYAILEPFMHLNFRAFFRKIHINNRLGVPPGKPVLLAVNHPTAFLDPILLVLYLQAPIYNMTRGDIFSKPLFRKMMEAVNMFPVYRRRDGYTGRDRNDEVFDWCVEKLRTGRTVTIYVEGEHHLEKRVRPVQKGIARIAFEAYTRHGQEDLQIIPVGCNYQYGDRAREEAMVNIGSPIFIRDRWAAYQQNPAAATAQLCADIEASLKTVCFHLARPDDDVLAEQLLTLHRSGLPQPPLPVVQYDTPRFAGEKAVLDALNALPEPDRDALQVRAERYFSALERAGLDDAALMKPQRAHLARLPLFMLFLPLAFVGWSSSWPVRAFCFWLAGSKVRKKEFYSSVVLGASFIGSVVYYGLLCGAAALAGGWRGLLLALLLPLLGWFYLLYKEAWLRFREAWAAKRHPEHAALLALRREIAQPASGITGRF